MRKLVMIALLFLIACQTPQKIMVQCWDGSIAESIENCPPRVVQPPIVETKPAVEIMPEPESTKEPISEVSTPGQEKTVLQQLLEKAPTLYWFVEGKKGVIVSNNKRSTGEYDQYWNYAYRLMYWDASTKKVYVLGHHIAESWWLDRISTKNVERKTTGGLGSTKY